VFAVPNQWETENPHAQIAMVAGEVVGGKFGARKTDKKKNAVVFDFFTNDDNKHTRNWSFPHNWKAISPGLIVQSTKVKSSHQISLLFSAQQSAMVLLLFCGAPEAAFFAVRR
jgi:hypothetical protein